MPCCVNQVWWTTIGMNIRELVDKFSKLNRRVRDFGGESQRRQLAHRDYVNAKIFPLNPRFVIPAGKIILRHFVSGVPDRLARLRNRDTRRRPRIIRLERQRGRSASGKPRNARRRPRLTQQIFLFSRDRRLGPAVISIHLG